MGYHYMVLADTVKSSRYLISVILFHVEESLLLQHRAYAQNTSNYLTRFISLYLFHHLQFPHFQIALPSEYTPCRKLFVYPFRNNDLFKLQLLQLS